MSPLIKNAIKQAIVDSTSLANACELVETDKVFTKVCELELVREICLSSDGVILFPLQDPHLLRKHLETSLDCRFTREYGDSAYNWCTQVGKCLVWIMANEHIDLTGTIVTDPKDEITH